MTTNIDSLDAGLAAVKAVYEALRPLDDNARRSVLNTVADLLSSPLPSGDIKSSGQLHMNPAQKRAEGPGSVSGVTGVAPNGQSAKDFMKAKQPISDVQRIACLAYYLTHYKSQPKFKTRDLTLLNSEAGGSRMSNPSMTAINAERQNSFLAPAGDGKKQITAYGEDIVRALPDQEAVAALVATRRKPRKKRTKKAPAK